MPLQPSIKNQFRITFLDENRKNLEFSDVLSSQVLSCSEIFQRKEPIFDKFLITLEDDITNNVSMSVQKLNKLTLLDKPFEIDIHILNSDGQPARIMNIKQCYIDTISFGVLSYKNEYALNHESCNNVTLIIKYRPDLISVRYPK